MIGGLRTAHRWIWLVLAILLPVLLVLALRARSLPPLETLPAALAPEAQRSDDSDGAR